MANIFYKNTINELLFGVIRNLFLIGFLMIIHQPAIYAQQTASSDSLPAGIDSNLQYSSQPLDSLEHDKPQNNDTISQDTTSRKQKRQPLEGPVNYSAEDSISIDIQEQKIYLYGKAKVTYGSIILDAAYIEFGMKDKTVYASGLLDSTDQIQGKPVFQDDKEKFDADEISYNFDTKQGVIKEVKTEQEGGYLHGNRIKRHPNEHIHIKKGKYTTCDKEHPDYYMALTKAIVIPKDKIVSGPAYMVIEDIPLYFAGLPFGFFPNTTTSKSGIIIPDYGEEERRGFFLKDGGWYFALNEYMDLTLTGSYYTNKSWGVNSIFNYKNRYRFSGKFQGDYYQDVFEIEDTTGVNKETRTDIRILWRHRQDPKANPYRNFSANVNFSTSNFDRNQTYNYNSITSSTKRSSISYNQNWPNRPFTLGVNLRHSQNSKTQQFNLKLPEIQFNMARQMPFKGMGNKTKTQWYENIQVSYSARIENNINTYDSILFGENGFDKALRQADNGLKHTVPISMNIKSPRFIQKNVPFLRSFTLSPKMTYEGVVYTEWIREKKWESAYDAQLDSTYPQVVSYRDSGIIYGHSIKPSLSASINPKIYGMFQSLKEDAAIQALRHVITPSASLSFSPDIRNYVPNYYDTIYSYNNPDSGVANIYSKFDNRLYGTPSLNGKSANLSLGLKNTLEMKVRAANDTAKDYKKIKLLERFDFSTNYNIFKEGDTLKWNNIRFAGGTRILNNLLDVNVTASLNPYDYKKINGRYRNVNESYLKARGGLFRVASMNTSVGFNINDDLFSKDDEEDNKTENDSIHKEEETKTEQGHYNYFNLPWNLNVSYNLNRTQPWDASSTNFVQTINFSGSLRLTSNWRIRLNSGYDFMANKITYTTANIYRDLHCWEMSLNFAPFGRRKFYFFKINIKSSILGDIKYEKRKNPRDYY